MHHSGCTPRQPTPFEIRTMRPTYLTVAEGPERMRFDGWLTTGHVNIPATHIDFACYRGISPLKLLLRNLVRRLWCRWFILNKLLSQKQNKTREGVYYTLALIPGCDGELLSPSLWHRFQYTARGKVDFGRWLTPGFRRVSHTECAAPDGIQGPVHAMRHRRGRRPARCPEREPTCFRACGSPLRSGPLWCWSPGSRRARAGCARGARS